MENQTKEFRRLLDDRFGMFVHYGIYSAFEGYYNGQSIPFLGEWIQRRAQIPIAEYEKFGREHFCPAPDFAKNLVKHAKEAGIRYIVLTSKHHDGFCLFKSEVSEYSTYGFFGRDICKELEEACREAGLGVGFYYSHTLDWHERNAAGNYYAGSMGRANNRNFWDYPDDNIDFEQYLEEKCIPQVKELLTNYGEVKIIWFDFPHDITKEQSARLRDVVKSIQPDCQINSRIAHNLSDYESLGDNSLPSIPVGVNMECLITLNDTWGYKRDDHNWKKPEDTIDILCRTLTSDATLLLNVGPMADGSLTTETIHILEKMGEWTTQNEDAVYGGVKGNPLPSTYSWGYLSVKENAMYVYVKDKKCRNISISGIQSPIQSVELLGSKQSVSWAYEKEKMLLELEENDLLLPVYKVSFAQKPVFSDRIIQSGDTLSLGVFWGKKYQKKHGDDVLQDLFYEKNTYIPDYGKHGLCINKDVLTSFWNDSDEILCWDAEFTEAGEYEANVIHASTFEERGESSEEYKCEIWMGEQIQTVNMQEEKERFRLSKTGEQNVRIVRDGGTFVVPAPGCYRICFSFSKPEEAKNIPFSNIKFVKKS